VIGLSVWIGFLLRQRNRAAPVGDERYTSRPLEMSGSPGVHGVEEPDAANTNRSELPSFRSHSELPTMGHAEERYNLQISGSRNTE
jgi:hypothetical protein